MSLHHFLQCKLPFRATWAETFLNHEAMANPGGLKSRGLSALLVSTVVTVPAPDWVRQHTAVRGTETVGICIHCPVSAVSALCRNYTVTYINCLKGAEVSTAQLIT